MGGRMPSCTWKFGSVRTLKCPGASSPEAGTRSVAENQETSLLLLKARTISSLTGLLVALAVTGCSIPPASVTAKLTSGISVSAPLDGTNVTSPFSLTASANTCGSQPVVSMSYSIDGGQAVAEPASFNAQVAA